MFKELTSVGDASSFYKGTYQAYQMQFMNSLRTIDDRYVYIIEVHVTML